MAYERMVSADALCGLGAAIAVNGFKALDGTEPVRDIDELTRHFQIEAYLQRCIFAGAIPTRRWPLYGIEPDPRAGVQGGLMQIMDTGLMVFISDFREWAKRSGIAGAETWADALSDSMQWNDHPEPGSQVVPGTHKGRPATVPDEKTVQADANEIGWELYSLNARMPVKKNITPKLAAKYGASEATMGDRYAMKEVRKYIETQKQLKQQK